MLDPLPDKPFISAYGTTYNHEDFVAEAIESVLAQGWPADRFEYVLVDDGPPTRRRARQAVHEAHHLRPAGEPGDQRHRVPGDQHGCEGTSWRPAPATTCGRRARWSGREPSARATRNRLRLRRHGGDRQSRRGRSRRRSCARASCASRAARSRASCLAGNFVSGGSIAVRGELQLRDAPDSGPRPRGRTGGSPGRPTNVTPVGSSTRPCYLLPDARRELRVRAPGRGEALGSPPKRSASGGTCSARSAGDQLAGRPARGGESLRDLLIRPCHVRPAARAPSRSHRRHRSAAERLAADAAAIAGTGAVLAAFSAARAVATDPTNGKRLCGAPRGLWSPFGPGATTFETSGPSRSSPMRRISLPTVPSRPPTSTRSRPATTSRSWPSLAAGTPGASAPSSPRSAERIAGPIRLDILAVPANPAAWLTGLRRPTASSAGRPPRSGSPPVRRRRALRAFVAQRWRFPYASPENK